MNGGIQRNSIDPQRFVGRWCSSDSEADRLLNISWSAGKYLIAAEDAGDGEEFCVANTLLKRGWLSFELLVPSTGFWTSNRLQMIDVSRMKCLITREERWRRLSRRPNHSRSILNKAGKHLVGDWADFECECRYQHDLTLVNTISQTEDNPPALVEQAE